ncbi:MAG: FecR domain-containing protein [Desulfobacterales bacterium]|nr:FecR domain-containing protein [Desulfobacterales bacterium]
MNSGIQHLLERFLAGDPLNAADFSELKVFFSGNSGKDEVNRWLSSNWDLAGTEDVEPSYEGLKQKIDEYENRRRPGYAFYQRINRLSVFYQRAAAVLFIPLILGLSFLMFYSPGDDVNFYVSSAPVGQKARLELPDGSLVFLNSGSSIRYASDFNEKGRDVELEGEAFFDVEKNTGKPFFVRTPYLDVEVTGTRFNVNAYADEPVVETALVEGKVNLILGGDGEKVGLLPGKVLSYTKSTRELRSSVLNEEATLAWKEGRLVFINDDFSKLARKVEKWFGMEVVYDADDFRGNKLTVKLLEGEHLDRLLEIIGTALDADCTVREGKIYLKKN